MKHWSVDEVQFKKEHPEKYALWKQVQLINYGLGREKLDQKIISNNWTTIKEQIDPLKRAVIEYWLWEKHPSLPNYKNGSWSWS